MKIRLKKSKAPTTQGIQTADMGASKFSLKGISKKRLLVFAGLGLLVLASAAWLLLSNQVKTKEAASTKIELKKGQTISGQVDAATDEQAKQIANSNVAGGNDTEKAYAKALALSKLGDQKGSAAEFKIIITSGKATYYMYQDYALVLARGGDLNGAISATQSAIDMLGKDSTVDQYVKTAEINKLQGKLDWLKLEAAQR